MTASETKRTSGGLHKPSASIHSKDLLAFVGKTMAFEGPALGKIRLETPKKGLPPISIGPDEGQILDLLVRLSGAKKALEIGTLAGYSSCWIARALPEGGKLHTIEYEPAHAAAAQANFKAAGLDKKIRLHQGPALEVLPQLEKEGPFDLVFIDADKVNYPKYLRWAIPRLCRGGLAVGDNAYFFGKLHLRGQDAGTDAPGAEAMREFLALLCDREFFSSAAMIPTGEGMAVGVRC